MGARDWVVGIERAWDRVRLRGPVTARPTTSGSRRTAATAAPRRASSSAAGCSTTRCPRRPSRARGSGPRRGGCCGASSPTSCRACRCGSAWPDATVEAVTDAEGYFLVRLRPDAGALTAPLTTGTVELAGSYRGLTEPHTTTFEVFVPPGEARFGVISDVDDTILETGVQRVGRMVRQTLTGSALTRTTFEGAPSSTATWRPAETRSSTSPRAPGTCSRSSSPSSSTGASRRGPVLLRDLLGTSAGREAKAVRLHEILDLHPHLRFVLIGDSGEHDPQIYADLVRAYPGRVLAVYIREVRLDPGDGRVEEVSSAWAEDVPFVLAADSDAVRRHAAGLGLL